MNRYSFLIDYRFVNKNFVNEFLKRFDYMIIFEKKVENNRQILKQLQKLSIANSKYFEKIRINTIKIMNTMYIIKQFINTIYNIKRRSYLNNSKIELINVISKTFDSKNLKRNRISINFVSKTINLKNLKISKYSIE